MEFSNYVWLISDLIQGAAIIFVTRQSRKIYKNICIHYTTSSSHENLTWHLIQIFGVCDINAMLHQKVYFNKDPISIAMHCHLWFQYFPASLGSSD